MLQTDEVCGSCKYNQYDEKDADFICSNHHSDYFTDYIPWNFSCECWEERAEVQEEESHEK